MAASVKKNVILTMAHGFELVEGEVKPVTHVHPGCFTTEARLMRELRREHPKFILDTWTTVRQTYEMPQAEFLKLAECTHSEEI